MLAKIKLLNDASNQTLNKEKIILINRVYGEIRFILTRFGRIINLFDVLNVVYKKKKSARFLKSKQPPAIRKIQQMESTIFSTDSQFGGIRSPNVSIRSYENVYTPSLPETYSPISSLSSLAQPIQWQPNEKLMNEPGPK